MQTLGGTSLTDEFILGKSWFRIRHRQGKQIWYSSVAVTAMWLPCANSPNARCQACV